MQYTPFASDIELPFYSSLANFKINHDKLDDSARKLLGLYEIRASDKPEGSCRMQIHGNALTSNEVPVGLYRAEGMIKNFNTIEEYKNSDKAAYLQRAGKTIWDAIQDGTIYSCPSLLASFAVVSYANLKKYTFSYWFAFPALHSEHSWSQDLNRSRTAEIPESRMSEHPGGSLTAIETTALVETVQTWRYSVDARQHGFFLAKRVRSEVSESSTPGDFNTNPQGDGREEPNTWEPSAEEPNKVRWTVSALSAFESGFFKDSPEKDCFVCFADPSNYENAPGWMLRNLLVLVRQRWTLSSVQVLRYRDTQSRRDQPRSQIMTLRCTNKINHQIETALSGTMPKVTGWERNAAQKLSGRIANLTDYMDPQRLADQSVDLNLKLMKWRISPDLNLEKIKATRCLLLGAGTLGSYVARNLLGWGVRTITFVDNASVSFSNPVRQPLFGFKDCLDGGAKKALRAAEALSEIYPGVDAKGYVMSVPMAGHEITNEDATRKDFEILKRLIDEHDAIFLLMDTRESRWLPTVMGKAAGKIVLNAALGFDTYVVMRHGVGLQSMSTSTGLGCYFCNDVVAPADSVKDQTLDQQCTVTRPGVASLASALLVELYVSILQHPDGAAAPAAASATEDRGAHPLGIIPHQIRGFLANFSNMLVVGQSYDCCSACSSKITDAYLSGGWDFVYLALNQKGYVEEISGLKEVQEAAEKAAANLEWDVEDDETAELSEGELL